MVKYKSQEAFYYGKKRKETCTQNSNDRRKANIIQQLLQEYDIETAEDIQDALKDLLGGTIKEMMEAWISMFRRIVNQHLSHRL